MMLLLTQGFYWLKCFKISNIIPASPVDRHFVNNYLLTQSKIASRCFDRTIERIQECQKSTPDVLVPTSSNFTAKDIPSNFDKITRVSTQTPPKSHRY